MKWVFIVFPFTGRLCKMLFILGSLLVYNCDIAFVAAICYEFIIASHRFAFFYLFLLWLMDVYFSYY